MFAVVNERFARNHTSDEILAQLAKITEYGHWSDWKNILVVFRHDYMRYFAKDKWWVRLIALALILLAPAALVAAMKL